MGGFSGTIAYGEFEGKSLNNRISTPMWMFNIVHTYNLKCLHSPLPVLYGSLDLRLMGPAKSGSLLSRLHLEKLNKDFLVALYLVVVVLYSLRFQEFCHQIQSTQIVDAGFQAPPQNQMFQLDLLNSL